MQVNQSSLVVMALKRIFLLSDLNQDSYLDDNEILGLQKKCFNKSIDVNELNFIKDLLLDISKHDQEYINRKSYTYREKASPKMVSLY